MKYPCKAMIVAVLLLLCSGCAGVTANIGVTAPFNLRGAVPESFHFTIRDKAAKEYLSAVDPESLPADQQLEVAILREMVTVQEEDALRTLFDRIWNSQERVKTLIRDKESRAGFICPLAEIYYLLSAPGSPDWQDKMARSLYDETLRDVEPRNLAGYALHFHALALLKNGKYAASVPYLEKLANCTSSSIYMEDLLTALDYSVAGGDYTTASGIMAAVCRHSVASAVKLPDRELESAILRFKKGAKLDEARTALSPVLKEHPCLRERSFAQLLREPEQTASPDVPKGDAAPIKASHENKKDTPADDNHARKNVRVEIQVIKAGNRDDYIDPALGDVGSDLGKTLSYSSFTLISRQMLSLSAGGVGELDLSNGNTGQFILHEVNTATSRLEVRIFRQGEEVFNTFVESVNGGVTIVGGPRVNDGVLLLRLTVYIVKEDVENKPSCIERNALKVLV